MKTFTPFLLLLVIYFANFSLAKEICLETTGKTRGQHVGCFEDHENQRMFRGFLAHYNQANSIEACVNTCHSRHFVYAGAQNGHGCYCGNSHPLEDYHARVSDKKCDKKCPGHSTENCGGYGFVSVHETGIEQFLISGKGKRLEDSNTISDMKWKISA
uniref:Allergen Cul o 9 n=1 Tax=Culicoides obsoletus TaxID=289301 RepID=A0A7U3MHU8_CULOB|nr:allergen Cul o 9 [Culicoides obsoletus]